MTETSKPKTDIPDNLYGTREGLFYIFDKQVKSDPEALLEPVVLTAMPIRQVKQPYVVPGPSRRTARKVPGEATDECAITNIMLQDSFIFLSPKDRQRA